MPATREKTNDTGCLGAVIRKHRERQQLTVESVAERLGVQPSTLEAYESDNSPVPERMIAKLADALGVDSVEFQRDCLFHARPQLANRPFGQLIGDMLDDGK